METKPSKSCSRSRLWDVRATSVMALNDWILTPAADIGGNNQDKRRLWNCPQRTPLMYHLLCWAHSRSGHGLTCSVYCYCCSSRCGGQWCAVFSVWCPLSRRIPRAMVSPSWAWTLCTPRDVIGHMSPCCWARGRPVSPVRWNSHNSCCRRVAFLGQLCKNQSITSSNWTVRWLRVYCAILVHQ